MAPLKPPSPPWVSDLTVSAALRRTVALYPDRDAVVFPALGVRWSWSEFDRRADSVASGLLAQGVERGEHVGIWSMNAPEWVVTQFAVGRIGAILVNINPAYRLHELEETLAMADVATLIVGGSFKDSNFVEMVETICPEVARADSNDWVSAKLPRLRRLISLSERPGPAWLSWTDLETGVVKHEDQNVREQAVQANDVYNIQFTSGTTGLPKGAMLSSQRVDERVLYR